MTLPISSPYAYSFAPVPVATSTPVFIFSVVELPPVIPSPDWNTPVCVDSLLTFILLSSGSIARIVACAFEIVPVMFSPTVYSSACPSAK